MLPLVVLYFVFTHSQLLDFSFGSLFSTRAFIFLGMFASYVVSFPNDPQRILKLLPCAFCSFSARVSILMFSAVLFPFVADVLCLSLQHFIPVFV